MPQKVILFLAETKGSSLETLVLEEIPLVTDIPSWPNYLLNCYPLISCHWLNFKEWVLIHSTMTLDFWLFIPLISYFEIFDQLSVWILVYFFWKRNKFNILLMTRFKDWRFQVFFIIFIFKILYLIFERLMQYILIIFTSTLPPNFNFLTTHFSFFYFFFDRNVPLLRFKA